MKKESKIFMKKEKEDEYQYLGNVNYNLDENDLLKDKTRNNNYLKNIIINLSILFFIIILIILIFDINTYHQKDRIRFKRRKEYNEKAIRNEKIEKAQKIKRQTFRQSENNSEISLIDFDNYDQLKNKEIIYDPILPLSIKEQIVTDYNISEFNTKNIRYHFRDIYLEREKYKINYSYFPYTKINKSLSYKENADIIYNSTGMLNITKLDYYYYNKTINTSKYNHINLAMGFDKNYLYLSLVSIAGILNTSSNYTYIHLHLCVNYFTYEEIEKIIKLNNINKNIEFLFYNCRQVELDFLSRARNEYLGIGDYNRVLLPQIVNNSNKILILDSGDILAYKDLSEIYYFDLEDNYFGWTLESVAGNIYNTFDKLFGSNFYSNSGVCLVNTRKFRKDNLYEKAFFTIFAYRLIPLPYQDIFLMISDYKVKFFPLKYNCKQFYDYKEQILNRNRTTDYIMNWIHAQKFSPFKYTKDEIYEAALDPVIIHLYGEKIQSGAVNKEYTIKWLKYANLTGFYKEIKKRYPIPFQKYENVVNE